MDDIGSTGCSGGCLNDDIDVLKHLGQIILVGQVCFQPLDIWAIEAVLLMLDCDNLHALYLREPFHDIPSDEAGCAAYEDPLLLCHAISFVKAAIV